MYVEDLLFLDPLHAITTGWDKKELMKNIIFLSAACFFCNVMKLMKFLCRVILRIDQLL
jgi:hypothetical protein